MMVSLDRLGGAGVSTTPSHAGIGQCRTGPRPDESTRPSQVAALIDLLDAKNGGSDHGASETTLAYRHHGAPRARGFHRCAGMMPAPPSRPPA